MLVLQGLRSGYNGVAVLHDVGLGFESGEVLTVLGSNGAGKTTLLRTISGILPPLAGSIMFSGTEISSRSPADVVSLGIAMIPEGRRVFSGLTVEENLQMGGYLVKNRQQFAANLDKVFQLFPLLQARRAQSATTLSGGEQQMLVIGRALMSSPRLLLLDEPSMGLAPQVIELLLTTLRRLRDEGLSILLVEQNASIALALADKYVVLTRGKVVTSGLKADLKTPDELFAAYVGD